MARNLAIDSYRAGATRQAAEAALRQAAATRETTVPGPHLEAEYGERLAQLEAAIRELPEEQRVILSMATAGGLTSREIGEALGEPAGTVRYRLSQARKQLAAALDLEEDTMTSSGPPRPGPAARRLGAGPAAAPTPTPSGSARPSSRRTAALSATWWSDFNARISAAIARATTTPAPALAALQ